jgi:hypothetical protein
MRVRRTSSLDRSRPKAFDPIAPASELIAPLRRLRTSPLGRRPGACILLAFGSAVSHAPHLLHGFGCRSHGIAHRATKRIESMADGSGSSAARSYRTLQNLAGTLGCSTEVFFGDTAPHIFADAEELLRLWLALENSSERLRVLDFVRAVKSAADAKRGDA